MDVRDAGNCGDGVSLDTVVIQKAIDSCFAQGGGTVYFPPGAYLTGTLYMRSRVTLHLSQGAVLLGSSSISEYATDTHWQRYDYESHMDRCLIFADSVDGVCLEGAGIIDGQGSLFPNAGSEHRPMLIRFLNCTNVCLRHLQLRNPASWTTAFIRCDTVRAESLSITSRVNHNGDGLDFDSCQNVFVSNCLFDTSDDSICLQNSEKDHQCKNILVQNCVMKSQWAAIRIGLLSSGDIEDVVIANCIFKDTCCSGLKIQSTEGGRLRRMMFTNLAMHNVPRPIFITLNRFHMGIDAPSEPPATGEVCELSFHNISTTCDANTEMDVNAGIVLVGTSSQYISDISISNVRVMVLGGKDHTPSQEAVPEMDGQRPEAYIFGGMLPAYGLYARHVKNLRISELYIRTIHPDCRPPMVLDDCHDVIQ